MAHHEIDQSGLTQLFNITPHTDNEELRSFIGKRVMYKPELLTPEFVRQNGTLITTSVYEVCETQLTHDGTEVLRGYRDDDTFGKPLDPQHIYIVD